MSSRPGICKVGFCFPFFAWNDMWPFLFEWQNCNLRITKATPLLHIYKNEDLNYSFLRQFTLCFNLYRDVRTKVDKRIFIYCFRLEIIRVKMLLFSVRQKLLFKLNSHTSSKLIKYKWILFIFMDVSQFLFYFILLYRISMQMLLQFI